MGPGRWGWGATPLALGLPAPRRLVLELELPLGLALGPLVLGLGLPLGLALGPLVLGLGLPLALALGLLVLGLGLPLALALGLLVLGLGLSPALALLLVPPLQRHRLGPQRAPQPTVPLEPPLQRKYALPLPPRQHVRPVPRDPARPRWVSRRPRNLRLAAASPPAAQAPRWLEPQSQLPPRRAAHLHRRATHSPPRLLLQFVAPRRVTQRRPEARRPFHREALLPQSLRQRLHLRRLSPPHRRPARHSKRLCRICPSS
ncbi:MAG: hypothetical protein JSR66_27525 [Proteobacteria bacterium]|nr:hypothetical protein [Pseudomonadota bacterium]